MPLDPQMVKLREQLVRYETEPPAGLEKFLPRRDGRSGKCFEDAESIIMDADADVGLYLVHGKCHSTNKPQDDHAWVEVPGDLVYDAVLGRVYPWAVYREKLQAVVDKRYDVKQVKAMTRVIPHCGPWTKEEEELAIPREQEPGDGPEFVTPPTARPAAKTADALSPSSPAP